GRTDDMIILRGVNLFPTQIEEVVLRTPGLSPHFALELTTRGRMDHLVCRVEARPDCPPGRRDAAAAEVTTGAQDTDATSMEELAARLGVTKSAIYHHVPSKGELLRLALDRALDALFAVTGEPGATTGRAIDRLEHVVRGSVRVLAEQLPFVTLLLRV